MRTIRLRRRIKMNSVIIMPMKRATDTDTLAMAALDNLELLKLDVV